MYISAGSTEALRKYIDEYFADSSKLYYFLNFTVAMQIIDKQTVYIKLSDGRNICLVNIGLHKGGNALYAVIVPNTKLMTKQRWKMNDFKSINEAFMTAAQLKSEYGIYSTDLPKASKAIRQNQRQENDRIVVKRKLIDSILKTFQSKQKIHIIRSKQNFNKSDGIRMSRDEFAHHAINSVEHEFKINLLKAIHIAHINHRHHTLIFPFVSFANCVNFL